MWAHGGLPAWPALSTGAGSAAQAAARSCWRAWRDALMATNAATVATERAATIDDAARTHAEAMTASVETLEAEIVRLRALPVIATCGDCSHTYTYGGGNAHNEGLLHCTHDDSPDTVMDSMIALDAPPPDWCPLRSP
jgi:hypothetical protein